MIFKRAVAKLRAQDWSAIVIELGIVILGVYIGTWVANRNQEQVERDNTIRLLNQFKPEIQYQAQQNERLKTYMAITGDYARVALAGWQGDPNVSDNNFVIAAYEASQATGSAINTQSWASIFGSSQVQNIRDPLLRSRLIRVLSLDSAVTDYRQTQTDYRKNVRQVLPDDVQDAIRARCDDVYPTDGISIPYLSPKCDLVLPPAQARAAAAALRARPSLVNDLYWHRAAVASMLYNFAGYVRTLQALADAIDHSGDDQGKAAAR